MTKNKGKYHEKFDTFYQSPEWKILRNKKFYDANGICENCYKEVDENGNHKIVQAREVHHSKPIETFWDCRLDYDNLILLCYDCHNREHERVSLLQKFLSEWDNI